MAQKHNRVTEKHETSHSSFNRRRASISKKDNVPSIPVTFHVIYLHFSIDFDGFTLLNNILTAGNSYVTSAGETLPAYTPYPPQLILAATLVVHPQMTTRAKTPEDLQASDEALRFLRNVNNTVGPINADFATVFAIKPSTLSSRQRVARRINPDSGSGDEDEDDVYTLNSPFANEYSVFAQTTDFWDLVGWAFNCSIKWKKRWERWKLWLEFALDVLDADWEERRRQADKLKDSKPLEESIILRYLDSADSRAGRRRVLRSILANGEEKALYEFGEVWKDETKERKIKENDVMAPTKKVDLDADEWGDYDLDVDEDEVADIDIEGNDTYDDFGGVDSMQLRQRFLLLVSGVHLPQCISFINTPACQRGSSSTSRVHLPRGTL
jgi:hypothetical protein